jgi:hypothetical protein
MSWEYRISELSEKGELALREDRYDGTKTYQVESEQFPLFKAIGFISAIEWDEKYLKKSHDGAIEDSDYAKLEEYWREVEPTSIVSLIRDQERLNDRVQTVLKSHEMQMSAMMMRLEAFDQRVDRLTSLLERVCVLED